MTRTSDDPTDTRGQLPRRVMLCTLAAVPAVAACGGGTVQSPDIVDDTGVPGDDAGDDSGATCPTTANLGPASAFNVGTYRKAGSGVRPFIVGRDANGYYAFSAVCTHEGCAVTLRTAGATYCPCHGATFDANGNVTRGPASRPLVNYLTTICNGDVYVDVTQSVAEGTRVTG